MRPQFKHERDEVQAEIMHDAFIRAIDSDALTLEDGASRAYWEEQRPDRKKFVQGARNWCERNPPAKQARARQRGDEGKNDNTVNLTHRAMSAAPITEEQRASTAALQFISRTRYAYSVTFDT